MSVLLIVFGMSLHVDQSNLTSSQITPDSTPTQLRTTIDTNQDLLNERYLEHAPAHMTINEHINISLVDGYYTNGEWTIPTDTAAYLTNAAIPGEQGNIIIYGHNMPHIFGRLSESKIDDIVSITLTDGTIREYRITLVEQIKTEELHYLQPTATEMLTIYTCAGWLDQERFLIRAVPV